MLHATFSRGDVCAQCPFRGSAAVTHAPSTGIYPPPAIVRRTIGDIVADVAQRRGLHIFDIESQSRSAPVAQARQEVYWIAHNIRLPTGERRYSLPMIGRHFAGRGGREKPIDHTTVLHGVRAHSRRLRENLIASIRLANLASANEHRRAA